MKNKQGGAVSKSKPKGALQKVKKTQPKRKDKKKGQPPVPFKGGKKGKAKHKWREVREKRKTKQTPAKVEEGESDLDEIEEEKDEFLNLPEDNDSDQEAPPTPEPEKKESLRERMLKRLEAARFRQINEELDSTSKSSDPHAAFQSDPEMFRKYHEAYRKRVEDWPKNPLDSIIKWVRKKMKGKVIADFGCGEARLSASVPNKVHSFDLYALNERVTACDMSNVPLEDGSVDAAIFCLSLMGTDVGKFVAEANRVLKVNGSLKIAEVASRFSGSTHANFLKRIKKFGFTVVQNGLGQAQKQGSTGDDVFLMFEFRKAKTVQSVLGRLPTLKLNPSVYKKR